MKNNKEKRNHLRVPSNEYTDTMKLNIPITVHPISMFNSPHPELDIEIMKLNEPYKSGLQSKKHSFVVNMP